MIGLSALIGVVVAWDAYAVKRKRETISSACRRTFACTPYRRAAFLALWWGLGRHLVGRAV